VPLAGVGASFGVATDIGDRADCGERDGGVEICNVGPPIASASEPVVASDAHRDSSVGALFFSAVATAAVAAVAAKHLLDRDAGGRGEMCLRVTMRHHLRKRWLEPRSV
jgi:hypothetical protein